MKTLVVLCLVVACVYGLPAKKSDMFDDDSFESFFSFPFGKQVKTKIPTAVEVDVGDSSEESSFFPSYFQPSFFNPFSFMNFGFSDFFSSPSWFEQFIPKQIPAEAEKNATSVTKIVNGHKITVNKTTFENEDNGAVFRFQVIEVSPLDVKTKGEQPTEDKEVKETDKKEPEVLPNSSSTTEAEAVSKPDQNSLDNEIHREELLANYELQGDDPSVYHPNVEMINIDKPLIKRAEGDLTDDIRVNTLLSENHKRGGLFMIPSDVEVFDTLDYNQVADNYQQQQEAQQLISQPNF